VIGVWLSIDDVFTGSHGPLYYGFAQIYGARTSVGGIGQAWTLAVEITFYAFLPVWAWVMRRAGVRGEIIGLACLWLFSLGWKLFALGRVAPSSLDAGPWLMPLPNFLDQFAVGMALALASVRVASVPFVERRPWVAWLGALVAFWLLSTQIGLDGRLGETVSDRAFLARHELSTVVAFGLLLPAIWGWQRRDAVRRVLGWRVLLYVGLVSYGVYLWHYAVIFKIATAINHWLVHTVGLGVNMRFLVYFVLGTLGAVAIATVSYRLIERPALSLKRLVGPPPDERREEAIAEPAPITLGSG
jgi:peptidoglycan/LPS O-acetylase OafA/YrhL